MSSEAKNRESLQKAAEKAATQVSDAAAIIGKGARPEEALANKIKDGPEDVIGEFNQLTEKQRHSQDDNPHVIAAQLDDAAPSMRFRVANGGRLLVPLVRDIVPVQGVTQEKQDLQSSDKDERKRREGLVKAGDNFMSLLKPASNIQTSLKYPTSTVPGIAKVITPGISFLSFLPSVITLGVIGFMKRHYKGKH